ncbi:unnamed protein product [Cuscuta europaea]|uniref:Uncharacterized protein n=1 Tax=Cuscuta europaea TaxID=41803 RepID=A0A9P0ZU26_CUSEU|nr:unnamed protein product [Cuscuta europaea]
MIDVYQLAMKERDQLRRSLGEIEAELCSFKTQCFTLESQLAVVTREHCEWEAKHDKAASELKESRSQIVKQRRVMEKLERQAEEAENYRARVSELEVDLASKDADLEKLRKERTEIRLASGHDKARIMSLESEVAATQEKLEGYMAGHSAAIERAKAGVVSEFQTSCSKDPAPSLAVN